MTRNIVAEFSSSVNSDGTLKHYQVVSGSVFTDEYSETLDSANIILTHITASDRLTNIKPYDFCRVYDVESWNSEEGRYEFDHVYLVDNYNEKEDNIKEHLYTYTIALMSETKLLEKIQCPNLTVTHEVENGEIDKKTIFEKICEYMELFIPKIKKSYLDGIVTKWRYEPLIEIPGTKTQTNGVKSEKVDRTYVGLSIIPGNSSVVSIIVDDLVGKSVEQGFLANVVVARKEDGSLIPASVTNKTFNSSTGTFDITVKNETDPEEMGHLQDIIVEAQIRIEYNKIMADNIYYYAQKTGYEDFYNKFNVPCADLGSAQYTLRTLLTMLMQQVGCIPTVIDLKLGFLDFNANNGDFELNGDASVNNTVNYINKSLASDSFVNTLVNMSSSVLDSGNTVISEKIGFRDTSNILLKQKENLVLETKFPIYKVNKFYLNCFVKEGLTSGTIAEAYGVFHYGSRGQDTTTSITVRSNVQSVVNNQFTIRTSVLTGLLNARISGNFNIYTFNFDEATRTYTQLENQTLSYANVFCLPGSHFDRSITFNQDFDCYLILGDLTCIANVDVPSPDTEVTGYFSGKGVATNGGENIYIPIDITPVVVENSKRSLLETNFKSVKLARATTLEEFTKFLYGTVGYSIGSNKITGFSSYYSQLKEEGTLFLYEYGETYIENIYGWLNKNYIGKQIAPVLSQTFGVPISEEYTKNIQAGNFDPAGKSLNKFTSFTFDIEYQPLNSFNLSYVKSQEDIDFTLEQLNNSDSGLSDFDRLSVNQQETVERIGNDTIFISQRITPDQISSGYLRGGFPFKPVYLTRDGKTYTIYKRTYTVGNYKYDVSYVGSKDAILKNYFTSIRTKYRAYQYVDYNQSVLRKEKDIIYVRLGEDYYNGDDKIYFKTGGEGVESVISGFKNNSSIAGLKYACESSVNEMGNAEQVKNELSVISSDYGFAAIYEQADNISAGPYVASATYDTYGYSIGEEGQGTVNTNYKLGGVPQIWQKWYVDKYQNNHAVYYTNNLNFYNQNNISFLDDDEAIEQIAIAAKAPIITGILMKNDANVMYVVDDNTNTANLTRTFYKDLSERLNHTVQFIYYSASENINWTENFIANNSLVKNSEYEPTSVYYSDTDGSLTLNKSLHSVESDYTYGSDTISSFVTVSGNTITVTWNGHKRIKVCHKYGTNIADFIVFRRPNNTDLTTNFYVTLNDTKSDYVMGVQDGVLYRKFKVKPNVLTREVENV